MSEEKRIIPRSEHGISRKSIREEALKVLYRLKKNGYDAYLVGGCVRDLLLHKEPKDFDVVTNAQPEQIRKLFRNSRIVGRRFKIVHVRFGRHFIEVATFRSQSQDSNGHREVDRAGMVLRDNVFGTLEEDAGRRDFTVNALYYNVQNFSVVAFSSGFEDLKCRQIRMIGDPKERYREDPVRMLRAIRFATKLGFEIEPETAEPIRELAPLLQRIPSARLFEEVLKLFLGGHAVACFDALCLFGLYEHLFPLTHYCLRQQDSRVVLSLVRNALRSTDERYASGLPVTPAFLFAVMLWGPMNQLAERHRLSGMTESDAMQTAISQVLRLQTQRVAIPRRFSSPMQDIWALQPKLKQRRGRKPKRLISHPRFRAAYDFMLLRAESGEELTHLCEWWTQYQTEHAQSGIGHAS